ncbi:MAG TPA: c-type cytochrome [Flavisolibacter sp.]|jgi:cytochrome c|nr:c-type cytochrome [Flavisolibacter sp.]
MKKILILGSFAALIMSCGNNGDTKASGDTSTANSTTTTASTTPTDPEAEKGLNLIASSDCFTCHKVADASTGPAYEAVAARYEKNDAVIDSLANKVIKGGSGNWGTMNMTPHPGLSPEDAKTMVKYVLSLKK